MPASPLCTLGMLALRSGWYAGEAWIKSVTDDVTGAYNRRYLLKRLNRGYGEFCPAGGAD